MRYAVQVQQRVADPISQLTEQFAFWQGLIATT